MVAVGANAWAVRSALETANGPAVVDALQAYGLDGLQIDTVARFSPSLDGGELAELRQHAAERSFYLEGGVPQLNPLAPDPGLLELGGGDLRRGLELHLRALRELVTGSSAVRAFIGLPWDRARAGASWPATWDQTLSATRALLADLLPLLRELDLRIAIENHGDATMEELIALSESVDAEYCGVCLDTANLLLTLEEPLEAVERVAPHTFATHLKDGIVVPAEDGGLILHARPCGEGVLRIGEIVGVLGTAPLSVVTIEDHDGLFPIPTHDPGFTRGLPAADALDELVAESVRRIAAHGTPSFAALEAVPWVEQEAARVRRGAEFVRDAFAAMALTSKEGS